MTKPQPDLQLIDRWDVIRMLGISESTLEPQQGAILTDNTRFVFRTCKNVRS